MHRLLWSAYCNAAVKDLDRDRPAALYLAALHNRRFVARLISLLLSEAGVFSQVRVIHTFMNDGTLHTPVCDFEPIFFFFPCAPSCSKDDPSRLRFIIYITVISVYIPMHQNQGTTTQNNHLSFAPLPACETYTLSFLFCRSSQTKFSLMCQLAARLPPGVEKKGLEKHRGLFWSRPLSPCPTAAVITQQETTAECRKWSCMHSLQEVECMPSRYSQGCNLWNNLCHCIKKKINYQVFCLICYKGEKDLFYMDEWGWDFLFFCFHVCSENKN